VLLHVVIIAVLFRVYIEGPKSHSQATQCETDGCSSSHAMIVTRLPNAVRLVLRKLLIILPNIELRRPLHNAFHCALYGRSHSRMKMNHAMQ